MACFLVMLAVMGLVRLAAKNSSAGSAKSEILPLAADSAGFFLGLGYFYLRKMRAIFFFYFLR